MTIKEFLSDKTLTGVEKVGNTILSLVIENSLYGIDVDVSNIPSGTRVERVTDFTIVNDILKISNIELNMNDVKMLGMDEELPN